MNKHIKVVELSILCLFIFPGFSFSQKIPADTILANQYFELVRKYEIDSQLDTAIFYAEKARALYIKYFGEKSVINANVLHLLGRLYWSNSTYNLALEYSLKALTIRREILGETHLDLAESYNNIGGVYYISGEYTKALEYFYKSLQIRKEHFGENHLDVAHSYSNIGLVYNQKGDYDNSLDFQFKALQIRKKILGEKHPDVASNYGNIGNIYSSKGEYDKALENFYKVLQIHTEILGEKHPDVASGFNNIGDVLREKGEYEKALEYALKALQIRKEVFGERHSDVASSYISIGIIYDIKGDYIKALEYYFKALSIYKEILGEKHPYVAMCNIDIGVVYEEKGEYDKALEYYIMSLLIKKDFYGEEHPDVALNYANIGNIYRYKGEYDKALEYFNKALQIRKKILGENHPSVSRNIYSIGDIYREKGENDKALEYFFEALHSLIENFGEKHPDIALGYFGIGAAYCDKGEYDRALEYFYKALLIREEIFGRKHPNVSEIYTNIGIIYEIKCEFEKALEYYQKGVASSLYDFHDTIDVYAIPTIRGYLDWSSLLRPLLAKAHILSDGRKAVKILTNKDREEISLRHYQACDTLIDLTRREISTQSDKLALGVKASQVYKCAVDLLTSHHNVNNSDNVSKMSENDLNLAFYFSEKDKSTVLLEALAGQEAQKYAGIHDTLLQKEHNLKIDIALYSKKLDDPSTLDSIQKITYPDRLFSLNRSYDSLITFFEKQFPEYYNLKYNTKPTTAKEVQSLLDKKTAMISYFTGDSTITIFTITKDNLYVNKVPQIKNLSDTIAWFRYGLTNYSPRMQEVYRRLGYKLYLQVFPNIKGLDKQIQNLYIIPDGNLSTLPFESLLTENYSGDINAYKDYPYLIRKFNISYSYSATLFNLTFSKRPSTSVEVSNLNDWLAFAPVFDNYSDQNKTLASGELLKQLNLLKTDSLMVNRSVYDRSYIQPLPGTETETETIFKLFDDKNLKAKVLLHNYATEKSIKSDETEHYKILHFATHGFVNSERPELSCLLMAEDTTEEEDGILYSGEIYNLNLNADLAVLSACETGLGKIQKGEGIIGLTRALLYAGAKNIIVSLWSVADISTSDLMVDFYKNSLSGKGQVSYSTALRNAKLKMIDKGKYAHPQFWSPFILIGK